MKTRAGGLLVKYVFLTEAEKTRNFSRFWPGRKRGQSAPARLILEQRRSAAIRVRPHGARIVLELSSVHE
jgi:hypothetical protein